VDGVILVFYLREARRKALAAARAEALCLLRDLGPTAPWPACPGGLARRHRLEANTHSRRLAFIRGPRFGRQVKVSVL